THTHRPLSVSLSDTHTHTHSPSSVCLALSGTHTHTHTQRHTHGHTHTHTHTACQRSYQRGRGLSVHYANPKREVFDMTLDAESIIRERLPAEQRSRPIQQHSR